MVVSVNNILFVKVTTELLYIYSQEFWFTAGATFFYFTAFVAILSAFVGYEDEEYQYWIDANIAAGVGQQ